MYDEVKGSDNGNRNSRRFIYLIVFTVIVILCAGLVFRYKDNIFGSKYTPTPPMEEPQDTMEERLESVLTSLMVDNTYLYNEYNKYKSVDTEKADEYKVKANEVATQYVLAIKSNLELYNNLDKSVFPMKLDIIE